MEHYQIRISCGVCLRTFVIDVTSWGTPHQSVQSVTCIECAEKVGAKLLKPGERQRLTVQKVEPPSDSFTREDFARFRKTQPDGW